MSTYPGPKKPYTEPKLPEPYEDLVSWIGVGGGAVFRVHVFRPRTAKSIWKF